MIVFLFLVPAQFILYLSLQILPGLSKPLPAGLFIPQALDCFGQGIAQEEVLRLLAAVDAELTSIGKVLTIMEQQVVVLVSQTSPGKGDRIVDVTKAFPFLFRILANLDFTALAKLLKRRGLNLRIPPVDGIVIVAPAKEMTSSSLT